MVGCCCHVRQLAPGRSQLRPSPAGCRRRTSVPALALFPQAGGRGVQRPVRPAVDRRKPGCDPPLRPSPPTAGRRAAEHRATGTQTHPGIDQGPPAFDDHLMDKLSAHRMRGPLIAVLGRITGEEAAALAPAAAYGTDAFALLAVERPAEFQHVLEVLRQGGWRAVAAGPNTRLSAVWGQFAQDPALPVAPAAEVRRGAGVAK